jgi:hypothetical protein
MMMGDFRLPIGECELRFEWRWLETFESWFGFIWGTVGRFCALEACLRLFTKL